MTSRRRASFSQAAQAKENDAEPKPMVFSDAASEIEWLKTKVAKLESYLDETRRTHLKEVCRLKAEVKLATKNSDFKGEAVDYYVDLPAQILEEKMRAEHEKALQALHDELAKANETIETLRERSILYKNLAAARTLLFDRSMTLLMKVIRKEGYSSVQYCASHPLSFHPKEEESTTNLVDKIFKSLEEDASANQCFSVEDTWAGCLEKVQNVDLEDAVSAIRCGMGVISDFGPIPTLQTEAEEVAEARQPEKPARRRLMLLGQKSTVSSNAPSCADEEAAETVVPRRRHAAMQKAMSILKSSSSIRGKSPTVRFEDAAPEEQPDAKGSSSVMSNMIAALKRISLPAPRATGANRRASRAHSLVVDGASGAQLQELLARKKSSGLLGLVRQKSYSIMAVTAMAARSDAEGEDCNADTNVSVLPKEAPYSSEASTAPGVTPHSSTLITICSAQLVDRATSPFLFDENEERWRSPFFQTSTGIASCSSSCSGILSSTDFDVTSRASGTTPCSGRTSSAAGSRSVSSSGPSKNQVFPDVARLFTTCASSDDDVEYDMALPSPSGPQIALPQVKERLMGNFTTPKASKAMPQGTVKTSQASTFKKPCLPDQVVPATGIVHLNNRHSFGRKAAPGGLIKEVRKLGQDNLRVSAS